MVFIKSKIYGSNKQKVALAQQQVANKACTRRWGFWRNPKQFFTPQHFPSRTAFRRPPQRG
jgi:hypothetical protein